MSDYVKASSMPCRWTKFGYSFLSEIYSKHTIPASYKYHNE